MSQTINYDWQYPEIFEPVFAFDGRYIALTGGRGSGKSWFIAHYLLEICLYKKIDVLCAREHQESIEKSSYKLLKKIIQKYKLPYKITNENISIITEDHSIVGEEVREGLLTEEMANNDERQNQLTKCLGADFTDISYDYILQEYDHDVCYMLCSDGFRKKLTNNEIQKNLCPLRITDKESSENILKNLTKTVITRGETDNITSLIVKIV